MLKIEAKFISLKTSILIFNTLFIAVSIKLSSPIKPFYNGVLVDIIIAKSALFMGFDEAFYIGNLRFSMCETLIKNEYTGAEFN